MGAFPQFRLTEQYAGLATTATLSDTSVYDELARTDHRLSTWFFEHPGGLLAIALAGQHPEPLTNWLRQLQSRVHCTTSLAGVVVGSPAPPESGAYAFFVPVSALAEEVDTNRLLNGSRFVLFLPHANELVIITEPNDGLGLLREFALPRPLAGLVLRASHLADQMVESRLARHAAYDPVDAQLREVLGPLANSAEQAVADLIREWRVVAGTTLPESIIEMQRSAGEFSSQLKEMIGRYPDHDRATLLHAVDNQARLFRHLAALAVHLRRKLQDYYWPPVADYGTYEEVATPLMLRAARNYLADVAQRCDLTNMTFLPILGDFFAIFSGNYSATLSVEPADGPNTVVVEIPTHSRLRLGAMPILAHEVAHAAHKHYDRLLKALCPADNPLARASLKELAADLIACAIVGPQFVFAMARFAVGTLHEFDERTRALSLENPVDVDMRRMSNYDEAQVVSTLPTRIQACLALLKHLNVPISFTSRYLPQEPFDLPQPAIELLAQIAHNASYPTRADLELVTTALRRGEIVSTAPVNLLAALWEAVSTRSGYLNEIAALASVAAHR